MSRLTVITTSVNSANTLRQCLDSLESQDFQDFDCIWVDGESTDDTINIYLSSPLSKRAKLISSPPQGVYHAFNIALNSVATEYVMFLNSDDFIMHKGMLGSISHFLSENPAVDVVFGNVKYLALDGSVKRVWRPSEFRGRWRSLITGWMPPHTASIVRTQLYRVHGLFDLSYSISADYSFFLKLINSSNCTRFCYLDAICVGMRVGGASNGSLSKALRRISEDYRIRSKYGLLIWITTFLKPLLKIGQLWVGR